jgi:hypothetical protein
MIHTKKIILTIPTQVNNSFDANYAVIHGRVHLYISDVHEIRGIIHQAYLMEKGSGIEGQLFNCRLVAIGEEYEEYVAEVALLGQSKTYYDLNRYITGIFQLSNDILRFFDYVWDIENPSCTRSQQVISFLPREERKQLIHLNDNITLCIERGYRQSYSKIRYEAHSSAIFLLHFKEAVAREQIFHLMQAIADYYFLFCKKPVNIDLIKILINPKHQVGYFGDPASDGAERDYFSNALIEQRDIDQYSTESLVKWVKEYDKCKVCTRLMKDAEKVNDQQLKFIWYSRAIEVFHKEFFSNSDKNKREHFDELFHFISTKGLLNGDVKDFRSPRMTLAHRIYDLVRYAYTIFSHKNFRLLFGYIIKEGGVQQLADTRNYLVHFSDNKKDKSFDEDSLHHINFTLFLMLKVLLLKRFDFTDKAIESVVNTFYRDRFGV